MVSTAVIAFTSIGFLFLAAATPASAQAALSAGGSVDKGVQNTAAIPDFSGIWGHLTFPDVEPPLNGAGPVRNLSRVTIEAAPTLAPYNGAATAGASPNGVSNVSELVGDFTNPILKPEAAEVVKQHGELAKKRFPIPRPATSAGPAACLSCFGTSACKCCNRRTKSRFSTQTIMLSATCI
jgi:hypothetical protein